MQTAANQRKIQNMVSVIGGVLLIFLEVWAALSWGNLWGNLLLSLGLAACLSLFLGLSSKSFRPCLIMTATSTLLLIVTLFVLSLSIGLRLSGSTFLLAGINVFTPLCACLLIHFFDQGTREADFYAFLKQYSILVGVFLLCALFLHPTMDGLARGINLVPFQTFFAYLTQAVPVNASTVVYQLLVNIALFLPIGFLFSACLPNVAAHRKFLAALALSIVSEATQYIFATGVADIDDVLLHMAGYWLGVGLCSCICILYKRYQRNREARFINA